MPTKRIRPSPGPIAHLALAGPLLLLAAPLAASPDAPLAAVLERIERECRQAYPADLRAELDAQARERGVATDELRVEKGIFVAADLRRLVPAFRQYLSPGIRFLDLGSGDGRVVFLAAALGADATGIEYDPRLAAASRRALAALDGLFDPGRVRLVEGDFFAEPWSGYDVIFYYDAGSFAQKRLRRKIRRELAPEARLLVYYLQAGFPGLEIEKRFPDLRVFRLRAASR